MRPIPNPHAAQRAKRGSAVGAGVSTREGPAAGATAQRVDVSLQVEVPEGSDLGALVEALMSAALTVGTDVWVDIDGAPAGWRLS